jgi:hypothetical protein
MHEKMRVLKETTGTKGKKKPKKKKKKEEAELGQVAPGSVQGA